MNAALLASSIAKHQGQHALRTLEAVLSFGVAAKAIATKLDTSETTLSLWRRGHHVISEPFQGRIYALARECLDSKQETIRLIKAKGGWDRAMSSTVNRRFAKLAKLYYGRPSRFKTPTEETAA